MISRIPWINCKCCDSLRYLKQILIVASIGLALSTWSNQAWAQPANDECTGAIQVFDGTTNVNLLGATTSVLDPAQQCPVGTFPFGGAGNDNIINRDVWFRYTATCTGELFIDTCGSPGTVNESDTRIAIHDDLGCGALLPAPINCNDDSNEAQENDGGNECPEAFGAGMAVPVVSGNSYLIRVGRFAQGAVPAGPAAMPILNIECRGPGACCLLGGSCSVETSSNCTALGGTYLGNAVPCPPGGCTGACCINDTCQTLTITDCESQLPIPGFFQGFGTDCNVFDPCTPSACCDGNGFCALMNLFDCDVIAGAFLEGQSCTAMQFEADPACAQSAPGNAQDVACNGSITLDNSPLPDMGGFNPDFDCIDPPGDGAGEFWITFLATDTSAFITTIGSENEDTLITVFTGPDANTLTPVPNSCNDDRRPGIDLTSEVCIDTVINDRYWVLVASFPNTTIVKGPTTVAVICPCPAQCESCPADMDGSANLDGADIQLFTSCVSGGVVGDPCVCADVNQDDQIDMDDVPEFVDAMLTGGSCFGACCDGNNCLGTATESECTFVLGGTFYQNEDCGSFACPPAAADNCVNAFPLVCNDPPLVFSSANLTSGTDAEDPISQCEFVQAPAGFAHDASGWFSFVPTAATATISLCATPTEDSVMTLFGPNPDCANLPIQSTNCDDDFCVAVGFGAPQISATGLVPGQTYIILIDYYSGGHGNGPHSIEITCP